MPPVGLETLEDRRYYAASVKLDSVFGTVATRVGDGVAFAMTALPLPGGRVLVYGRTVSPTAYGNEGAVFAMYDANGRLDRAFNHGGLLTQDYNTSGQFGFVDKLQALRDGGILVSTSSGVRRMELDGSIDTAFGNGGLLPKHTYDPVILPDGTVRGQQQTYDRLTNTGTTRLLTFDAHGHYLAETPFVPALGLTPLPDGRYAGVLGNDRLTVYDDKLQPDPAFGTNGTAYVGAAAVRWAAKHGPWYARTVTPRANGRPAISWTPTDDPKVGIQTFVQTPDGGFQVLFYVRAAHAPTGRGDGFVARSIRLTASGGIVDSVMPSRAAYRRDAFTPSAEGTFNGTFHFAAGNDVGLHAPVAGELINGPYSAIAAADGSYYLVGQINNGLGVIHTAPVVGSIGGTIFSDTNDNGRVDANETRLANRVVYLDANDNGRFDAGEASTMSDGDGRYTFDDLGPGQYVVRRVLPKGYTVTRPTRPRTLAVGQRLNVSIGSVAA